MKRLILSLLLIIPVIVSYTNCSSPTELAAGSSSSSVALHNGGGHSGKLSYFFTHAVQSCSTDPDLSLIIEGGNVESFRHECNQTVATVFDQSQLVTFANDPFFVVYDEKIYADETALNLQKNENAHFELFCSSSTDIDFAIRYSNLDSPSGSTYETHGLLVRKGEQTIEEDLGVFKEPLPVSGIQIFTPTSREYDVRVYPADTPTRATANITFAGQSTTLALDCYKRLKTSGN